MIISLIRLGYKAYSRIDLAFQKPIRAIYIYIGSNKFMNLGWPREPSDP